MSHPELNTMIEQLIATPSISCANHKIDQSNRPVIDKLQNWLSDCGFSTRVLPVDGVPGKVNLVATMGKGKGGLILAGHSDTVPFDDKRWQSDPFVATQKDDRLYGLGTADMKSFIAMAIKAANSFRAKDLNHPLVILATADEETSMAGARALCANDLSKPRYAVIGEPTGLIPVYQHKGMLMEAITIHGQSGHSSDPDLGNSALEGMHMVIASLLELRNELQQQYHCEAFSVPVPTLSLGHIHGGDSANRICGDCELHFDCRLIPGLDSEALRKLIRDRVSTIADERGLSIDFRPLFAGVEAFKTDLTSPIVRACQELTASDPISVNYATEAPFLNALGIDTVVIGPGSIDQAHQPDEYIDLSAVQPTVDLLESLIHKFCVA